MVGTTSYTFGSVLVHLLQLARPHPTQSYLRLNYATLST